MKKSQWFGAYANGWTRDDIIPDAFSHPAKFSKQLIRRIYEHLLTEGYIKPGQTVADPFGGVGLGAFWAMHYGLNWRGVELEPRFVDLARQNIELWTSRYAAHFPNFGTAEIYQGDSRYLASVLGRAGAIVGSPPFSGDKNLMPMNGQGVRSDMKAAGKTPESQTQQSPGNLALLRAGDVSAVISSPAYGDSVNGVGEGPGARFDSVFHKGQNATKKSSQNGYGETAGNLGNMEVGAVVTSPPFEASLSSTDMDFIRNRLTTGPAGSTKLRGPNGAQSDGQIYGATPGNVGNDTGNTFWQASAVILQQCYQILPPGGVAAFVTGDFKRSGQRVEFGRQWLALCEACGFVGLEHIAAWKREPGPVQAGIFGNDKDTTIDRVSFFRRLSNQRDPDNEIVNEDVWIVFKPSATPDGRP